MATYKTASKQLLNNYACISTLESTEIALGESVTVAGLAAPFAGTFTVLALPHNDCHQIRCDGFGFVLKCDFQC